jgi:hypothetical protein
MIHPSSARFACTEARISFRSITITWSGCRTWLWLVISRSSMRMNAWMGAPDRSAAYTPNAWTCFPRRKYEVATSLASVTPPWPPRPWMVISIMARLSGSSVDESTTDPARPARPARPPRHIR